MSIKELLNYKISVTHATVVVFVWVMTAIMAQFDLYQPIPWENIALVFVVIMVVLLSKQLDQQQQRLIALHEDKIRVDPELDILMRKMLALYKQYQKFYGEMQSIKTMTKSMSEEKKEQLTEELREADTPEEAEKILKNVVEEGLKTW